MRRIKTILLGSVAALTACADGAGPFAARDGGAVVSSTPQTTCESLAALAVPNVTLTIAESVPAGGFVAPEGFQADVGAPANIGEIYAELPAFCRIGATVTPVAGSEIQFELWMPADGWNGKFVGVGNGRIAGSVFHGRMAEPLMRGYAVANTDTGHQAPWNDSSWAVGRPEAVVDFAHRAVHEMAVTSKQLIDAYYGDRPQRSYWVGCSTGGRQGVEAVQRYPEDFDAVTAGAVANRMAQLQAHGLMALMAQANPPDALPASKIPLIHDAAVAACDRNDGLADGVINDPFSCAFDPGVLACEAGEASDACLTPRELAGARMMYEGAHNPRTGALIYPPVLPGSEAQWPYHVGDETISMSFYRYMVFDDPSWDYTTFDFDADVAAGAAAYDGALQSDDPDISAFVDRGGKLILWHGLHDPLVTPGNTIDYYESVVAELGEDATDNSVRLFLAPGVNHCRGGVGAPPTPMSMLSVLEAWVEEGDAPETIPGAGRHADSSTFARAHCRYPLVARYDGEGDPDDAASFSCVSPE